MWLFWALGSFAFAVLLHGALMRLAVRIDAVTRFLLAGLPIGAALIIALLGSVGFTVEACAAIVLYAFLSELYIFCFTFRAMRL
jgi:hypothetical protein